MKMYNKSDLKLVNGLLVNSDGDIVAPDAKVVKQANELETILQKAVYLSSQPEPTPMPSLDGFTRMSIDDGKVSKFSADTPLLDMEAKKSMWMMDELDDMKTAKQANEMLDHFKELISFVSDEHVIDLGVDVNKFDTPTLGNILELGVDDVVSVVALACGLEKDDDDDDLPKIKHGRINFSEMTEEEKAALLNIIKNHDPESDVVTDSVSLVEED